MQKTAIRVLLQQRILPPYRLAVFRELSSIKTLDVTLVYGSASSSSALVSISNPPDLKVNLVKNLFVGRSEIITIQFGLIREFLRQKPNILVLSLDPRSIVNLLLFVIAKWRKVPVVWWGHGVRPGGRFQKLYAKLCSRSAASILYYEEGVEKLVELGVPREKLFVASNSIETESISDLCEPYTEDRKNVIYVGRLIREKKVALLVEGFAHAIEKYGIEGNLIIIGDGPERRNIESKVESSKYRDRIQLMSAAYEQKDLAPYFNSSYVSASPGYVGLSAIHALAFGVPMLAADKEPHSPEIVVLRPGENSLFFRADSAQDLALKLWEMQNNFEQMKGFSHCGQSFVLNTFSARQMAENMARAIGYAANYSTLVNLLLPMVGI